MIKNRILALLIITLYFSVKSYGQYCYIDISPDIVATPTVNPPFYFLDINNDQIADIKFSFQRVDAYNGFSSYPTFAVLNSNLSIASNGTYATRFSYKDTISNHTIWNTNSIMLGQGSQFGLSSPWQGSVKGFIGLKLISGNDTLYGYILIRVRPAQYLDVTIYETMLATVPNSIIYAGQGLSIKTNEVKISDTGNNKNGNDLNISFNIPFLDSLVNIYRVFIVPSISASTFTIEQAKVISLGKYIDISPTGSNIQQIYSTASTDINGNPIIDLVSYSAFVMSIPDTSEYQDTLLSSISNSLILKSCPQPVQNIYALDIGDNGNSSDIQICFDRPSMDFGISLYRLFIVPNALSTTFNIDSAINITVTNYTNIDTSTLNPCYHSSSGLTDIYGQNITNNNDYNIFIMSVPDTTNDFPALSQTSFKIRLSTPDYIYAGQTNYMLYKDTTETASWVDTLYIDLNRDGINDCKLIQKYAVLGMTFYTTGEFKFSTMNNCQLKLNNNSPLQINQWEQITPESSWDHGNYLLYSYVSNPFSSSGNWPRNVDKYIGIRMINSIDTLYGWVSFRITDSNTILKGYAIQPAKTNIQELNINVQHAIIYPNPITEILHLKILQENTSKYLISINDIYGKLVQKFTSFKNENIIEVSKLKPGTYIIKVCGENFNYQEKFIKY